jgi:hypothetical protein
MKKLGAGLSIAFVFLVVACASSTRPPQHAAAGEADAGVEGEEDGETADNDGDAEVSNSELAMNGETGLAGPCPSNMVLITGENDARFCIDKYEASLVETDSEGNEKPFAHWLPVDGKTVRAVSMPDVFPQGFISEVQADDACVASGKRLCGYTEWKTACMGPSKTTFPYGNTRQTGVCHDTGKSAVAAVFGAQRLADPVAVNPPTRPSSNAAPTASKASSTASAKNGSGSAKPTAKAHVATKGRAAESSHRRPSRTASATPAAKKPTTAASPSSKKPTSSSSKKTAQNQSKRVVTPAKASTRPASVEPSVWTQLNDPRLGQVDGALSKTGSHAQCVNGFGVVDMVGNLHEWVKTDASLVHGTFAGGYYLDTSINGDGCSYKTQAHAHDYHDYSTGFRCCADAKPDP